MKFFSRYEPDNGEKIYLAYEKIIQIVKAKLAKKQTNDIGEIIEYLKEKFFSLMKLSVSDNAKFYELMLEKSQYDYYKENGTLMQSYPFHETLPRLSYFIGVFSIIWKEAAKKENTIVQQKVAATLSNMLTKICSDKFWEELGVAAKMKIPNRGAILNFSFRVFGYILNEGTKEPDLDKKDHLTYLLFYWYLHTIFQPNFSSQTLEELDRRLFEGFKIIIQKDEQELFESFVKAVIHGHYYPSSAFFDLSYIIGISYIGIKNEAESNKLREIKDKIVEFQLRFHNVFTSEIESQEQEKLNRLQIRLADFKKYLHPSQQDFEHQFESVKVTLKKSLKYNNLILSIVNILSYAIFKKRYGMLKFIFEFHQPKDTSATWGGADILPVNPKPFFELLAHVSLAGYKIVGSWDNHGAPDLYTNYLMLLILSRILKRTPDNQWHYNTGLGSVQSLNLKQRQAIAREIEKLLSYTGGFAKQTELLQILNLDEMWVKENLIPCLNTILKSTEESKLELLRKAPINEDKRVNFKNTILEYFNKKSRIRQLIRHFGGKDKISFGRPLNNFFLGTNKTIEKAIFIDNWNVDYSNFGEVIGESIAVNDNNRLIGDILLACDEVKTKTIKDWLLKNEENLSEYILIGINIQAHRDLVQGFNDPDFEYTNVLELPDKLSSFRGLFKKTLEVYLFHAQGSQKRIIILPKKLKGRLVQYSMKKPTEKGFEVSKHDIFYYELLFYSEDQKLLQKTIQDAPQWIKDLQNPYQKLQELGWLRIFLKSQFQKEKDFVGWFFNLSD